MKKAYCCLIVCCISLLFLSACGTKPAKQPDVTPAPNPTTISIETQKVDSKPKTIPILYYHSISDKITGMKELFVSPVEFEKQMNFLKENNYEVITFDQLKDVGSTQRPIIITLDDGYETNYLEAYPILKKFNYKATIFLCTNFIDKPLMLKTSQIKEMSNLINFQSHTLSHPDITKLSSANLDHELSESKKIIEQLTSSQLTAIAYPAGQYNEKVIETAKKYYKYGLTNIGGLYTNGVSNYEIKRVYVPRSLSIENFANKIRDALRI